MWKGDTAEVLSQLSIRARVRVHVAIGEALGLGAGVMGDARFDSMRFDAMNDMLYVCVL